MSVSFKDLERQARALSPEERAKLAEALLESIHSPLRDIEAEWSVEIERRVAEFDRGEMLSYPAEDVFAEARRLSK